MMASSSSSASSNNIDTVGEIGVIESLDSLTLNEAPNANAKLKTKGDPRIQQTFQTINKTIETLEKVRMERKRTSG